VWTKSPRTNPGNRSHANLQRIKTKRHTSASRKRSNLLGGNPSSQVRIPTSHPRDLVGGGGECPRAAVGQAHVPTPYLHVYDGHGDESPSAPTGRRAALTAHWPTACGQRPWISRCWRWQSLRSVHRTAPWLEADIGPQASARFSLHVAVSPIARAARSACHLSGDLPPQASNGPARRVAVGPVFLVPLANVPRAPAPVMVRFRYLGGCAQRPARVL